MVITVQLVLRSKLRQNPRANSESEGKGVKQRRGTDKRRYMIKERQREIKEIKRKKNTAKDAHKHTHEKEKLLRDAETDADGDRAPIREAKSPRQERDL